MTLYPDNMSLKQALDNSRFALLDCDEFEHVLLGDLRIMSKSEILRCKSFSTYPLLAHAFVHNVVYNPIE